MDPVSPMENALKIAQQSLLAPTGLDERKVAGILDRLMSHKLDQADVYFQLSRHESWSLEDGIVKDGSHSIEQGAGVRAIAGEKTGFAYSDEILLPELLTAAQSARAIAQSGNPVNGHALAAREAQALYAPIDPVESLANED